MNKSFLLLPLTTLILTACGSNTPAPVVNADDLELSPGVMQPVAGTGATHSGMGWQSDVQSTSMPESMNNPSYSAPQAIHTPTPQAIDAPAPQPVYKAPKPVTPVAPAPVTKAKTVTKPIAQKTVPQDFTIPRDENNAPIYSQISKGFYNGENYTVRKGDTMFLIAYIAGKDVKEIAKMNNMQEPYQLFVGQTLKVNHNKEQNPPAQTASVSTPVKKPTPTPTPKPVEPEVTYTQAANGTAYGSDGSVTGPVKAKSSTTPPTPQPVVSASTAPQTSSGITASAGTSPNRNTTTAAPASSIRWQWPTQGRVIQGYSASEGGNKGVDIAGTKGQAVKAAAAGRVVYAGNALEGYGNLIIIKHNDDFLSAYAHNDSIKVDEQDNVKAGETIATLGSTGTNSNKLHFEIRYKGKPVDPTRYVSPR
ncbi:hypothetical protein A4G19_06250 [Pasteurellaceae bacterium Macca]|nr:hypothetical protein [Pasteurellaceae bacterium Macca]